MKTFGQNLFIKQEVAKAKLIEFLDHQANGISGRVPEAERSTWDAKEAAVVALSQGAATERQEKLITIEAAIVGEDPATTQQKITENIAMFYIAGSVITGIRRRAFKEIDAATTAKGIEDAVAKAMTIFASIMADPMGFNANPTQFLEGLET